VSTRIQETPRGGGSSCWLQGCLILAMVVSAALVIVLVMMVLSRLPAQG
jgi:hypothetical protein